MKIILYLCKNNLNIVNMKIKNLQSAAKPLNKEESSETIS